MCYLETKKKGDLLLPPDDLFSRLVSSKSSKDSPELRFRRICPELRKRQLQRYLFFFCEFKLMAVVSLETNGKSWLQAALAVLKSVAMSGAFIVTQCSIVNFIGDSL